MITRYLYVYLLNASARFCFTRTITINNDWYCSITHTETSSIVLKSVFGNSHSYHHLLIKRIQNNVILLFISNYNTLLLPYLYYDQRHFIFIPCTQGRFVIKFLYIFWSDSYIL